jgi:isoquinoline 1-oxidoreductase
VSARDDDALAPERYELRALAAYRFELDRRGFVKSIGAGLVVWLAAEALPAQESGRGARGGGGGEDHPPEIAAWMHIAPDGAVTVYTGKVEFGQDARTSLAQAVAEELRVGVPSIRLVMGDTDLTPFDMGTFGSRTTPIMGLQLRKVAAAAREALLDLAAEQWQVARETLVAADGRVGEKGGSRAAGYGALSEGRRLVRKAGDVPTAAASEWTVAGRPLTRVNARDLVTGAHRYTSDLTREGMWHGKVLHPPALDATVVSMEDVAARMAGATVVRDGAFVGIAAPTALAARRAAQDVRVQWSEPGDGPSDADIYAYLKQAPPEPASGAGGGPAYQAGSVSAGLASAAHKLRQSYTVAYIAHAPLEPRAAVAEWTDGKLTVWTGTQRPFGVRRELAEAFRLPEEKVRVIVPDTGSGYGGKHTGETAIEAARLARATGHPVKVAWTREEEFASAYFRPAGLIEVTSGLAADGKLAAWEFHNWNSGSSAIRTPYEVAHQHIEFHPSRSPLRQGSYRGLAATANHFAREVHMDELARAAGLDPLDLRRRNLADARLRRVLDAAAERFGWPRAKAEADRGHGLAAGTEKGSYVAAAAEVAVDRATRAVRVLRVVTAFECGAIVNPDGLRNQVEGSVVQGLGGALFEAIRFRAGVVSSDRFSRYRVPRFSDLPTVEVVLLDRKDLPSAGAGETPIVTVAPAIACAIFDACGVRLRSLPLVPEGRLGAAAQTRLG